MDYDTYSVKQDQQSYAVAVRTVFPADGSKAWRVFMLSGTSHYVAQQDLDVCYCGAPLDHPDGQDALATHYPLWIDLVPKPVEG